MEMSDAHVFHRVLKWSGEAEVCGNGINQELTGAVVGNGRLARTASLCTKKEKGAGRMISYKKQKQKCWTASEKTKTASEKRSSPWWRPLGKRYWDWTKQDSESEQIRQNESTVCRTLVYLSKKEGSATQTRCTHTHTLTNQTVSPPITFLSVCTSPAVFIYLSFSHLCPIEQRLTQLLPLASPSPVCSEEGLAEKH